MPGAMGGFMAGSIVAKLVLDRSGFHMGMREVKTETQKMADNFSKIGKAFSLVGVGIVGGLGAIVKNTANAGDAIWDMSQRTGIGTELLSSYKLAAEKAGSSIEGFATGMRGLSSRMMDAKNGLAESKRAFDMLGVSVMDSNGQLRPLNDVLLNVADKFAGMEDGATKAALAQDIFGRSGMELIPLLNQGSDGLRKATDNARRFGVIFSREAAGAADKFNDAIADVAASLRGIGMQIGNILIPAATSAAQIFANLTSAVTGFARANGPVTEAVVGITGMFGPLLVAAGSFQLLVGTLIIKLPLLAASLHTTTVALAASTIAWTAAAAAAGYYVLKCQEAMAANDKSTGAATRFNQANVELSNKLYELVKVGAMSVSTYYELWDKYNGVAAAMAEAIRQGREGVVAQEALVKIGKEHAAVIDEQKRKLGLLGDSQQRFTTLIEIGLPAAREWTAALGSWTTRVIDGALPAARDLTWALQAMGMAGKGAATMMTDAIMTTNQKLGQVFSGLDSTISTFQNNRLAELNNEYNARLAYINANITDEETREAAIAKIDAEFAGKRRAALRAWGLAAKGAAIAQAIINTHEAAVKALAQGGFILGIPWAAIVQALGWVQVAAIAAQPIPMAEGATFEKPTLLQNVLVGEKRPEYLLDKLKLTEIVRDAMTFPRFDSAPAMAMAGAGAASGGTITMNFHTPLIQTSGLTRREINDAAEYLFEAINQQARRRGYSLK